MTLVGRMFATVGLASGMTLALLFTLPVAPVAATSELGVPQHRSGGGTCAMGTIRHRFPTDMRSATGRLESGYWRSELFRWNGSGWDLYGHTQYADPQGRTWYWWTAAIDGTGIKPTSGTLIKWSIGGQPFGAPTYGSLPRGSYLIRDTFYWPSINRYHQELGLFSETGTTICAF